MLINKTYTSFRRQEFVDYFSNIGILKAEGVFFGQGWEVKIGEERNKYIGNMSFITVDLNIEIRENISEEFLNNLRLAFLRGGG